MRMLGLHDLTSFPKPFHCPIVYQFPFLFRYLGLPRVHALGRKK